MKKHKIITSLLLLSLVISTLWFFSSATIEQRFKRHEQDFQAAAEAFLVGQKYTGSKRWLYASGPGEGALYLPFHMGDDFRRDYYDPQIVYIHSDKPNEAHLCSFDGRLIKKIKKHWYICKESRF